MASKKLFAAIILASLIALFHCGCAPQGDISLKFVPDQAVTYKAVSLIRKDYLFDQPSAGKKTSKMTEVAAEMTYDQRTVAVDRQDNATAQITIKGLKYRSETEGAVQVDFDSAKQADSQSALAKLIGQTYTIRLSPSGEVLEVSDVALARDAVKTGPDARFAQNVLRDGAIKRRHQILALPDQDKKTLKKGDRWSRVSPSPAGTLIPKTYEKTYTVKDITPDGAIARIQMNAEPTSKRSDTGPPEATDELEAFTDLFDTQDTYTGHLAINLKSGKVDSYSEKFTSRCTAAQMPKGAEAAKQPDVLQLAFTEENSIDAVD